MLTSAVALDRLGFTRSSNTVQMVARPGLCQPVYGCSQEHYASSPCNMLSKSKNMYMLCAFSVLSIWKIDRFSCAICRSTDRARIDRSESGGETIQNKSIDLEQLRNVVQCMQESITPGGVMDSWCMFRTLVNSFSNERNGTFSECNLLPQIIQKSVPSENSIVLDLEAERHKQIVKPCVVWICSCLS